MSDEHPVSGDRGAPGGRPPGASRRRRRGRGRGRGAAASAAASGAAAPTAAAGSGPAATPQTRPQGGRPERGQRRGGGGGAGRGGGDRGRRPQPAAQPQAARELEITDEKIFARLLDGGLDLTQEAVLEAFLYFAGETAARRVAARLEEDGYVTYVDPSPPGRWLLEAVSRGVPTPEHIGAMGESLRALARANSGIYDGWWASEPPEDEEEPAALLPAPEPADPLPDPEPAEA